MHMSEESQSCCYLLLAMLTCVHCSKLATIMLPPETHPSISQLIVTIIPGAMSFPHSKAE